MRISGRLAAAILILEDFEARRVPLKTAIADWARGARYAGAKDRAWISGLCLDVLRKRNSLGAAMGSASPRALALGAMRFLWGAPLEEIADVAAEEPHGPGALTDDERSALEREQAGEKAPHIAGDFPEWLTPHMERAFGDEAVAEGAALAARADIDLRINTLKTTPEKALAALASVGAAQAPYLKTAARIPAPEPSAKQPAVTVIPAFNKGWVEVQDLGSQIAASAAGAIKGAQVLDYCAGGGGKTLALAAMMENTGQLYAYDKDARRLKPLYARAKRAGVRNLQIVNPSTDRSALDALEGKMDVVFVDAPCTGSGTWRRHPDTKWRLTPQQLERRMGEQDVALSEAARFVKPGGRLVYVVCSFLTEEGADRVSAFLRKAPGYEEIDAFGEVRCGGASIVGECALQVSPEAGHCALRLTPAQQRTDGFYVSVLRKPDVEQAVRA